jgi:hypothetical protein
MFNPKLAMPAMPGAGMAALMQQPPKPPAPPEANPHYGLGSQRRSALIEHLKLLNHDGKQQLLRPTSRVTGA